VKKAELIGYLDEYLKVGEVTDYGKNGFQVGAMEGEVETIAFAVDASLSTFEEAVKGGAEMLFVHHGLFWKEVLLPTGLHYKRLGFLIENDLSLYAVHLPLDFHKECGNNHVMASKLGLRNIKEITAPDGIIIVEGEFEEVLGRREAFDRIEKRLSLNCLFWPFGPEKVKKTGICSGGASSYISHALEAGHDLYLTGEPSHSYYHHARDGRLNVAFGGHYQTETFGVQAMQQHLVERFGLKTFFIELPTGH
jgi:dinuclear metal center YbgI/SA1388 family protein